MPGVQFTPDSSAMQMIEELVDSGIEVLFQRANRKGWVACEATVYDSDDDTWSYGTEMPTANEAVADCHAAMVLMGAVPALGSRRRGA